VARYSELPFSVVAEILFNKSWNETVEAGRHRGMRGEQIARARN
jgi:hypothetical protein